RHDMSDNSPMRRLVQGDVGSGKTVVAACCALMAIESGFNVALMAPTEILAEQHFRIFQRWFHPLGVSVRLQTASHKSDQLQCQLSKVQSGVGRSNRGEEAHYSSPEQQGLVAPTAHTQGRGAGLVIGTHALLEANFEMNGLGLVIIDEQHKFGVAQREQLVRKGHYPHLLIMTATPIPRTLGLTVYGDLDSSTI